jgi:hypothetical protein
VVEVLGDYRYEKRSRAYGRPIGRMKQSPFTVTAKQEYDDVHMSSGPVACFVTIPFVLFW